MLQPHALHIIALVVVRRAQVYHQAFLIVLMQDYLRLFKSLPLIISHLDYSNLQPKLSKHFLVHTATNAFGEFSKQKRFF